MTRRLLEIATLAATAAGAASLVRRAGPRLALSRAKHRSLAGHAKLSRRVARAIPFYDYDDATFFRCDGAPDSVVRRREQGFASLADTFRARFGLTTAATRDAASDISDLQFTGRYRVPFQFARHVRLNLPSASFVCASAGVTVTDLDGNVSYDAAGSYGVNLFGPDFYKACLADGAARVAALGPVLGAYHPLVRENARRLRAISGHDEVSFHMSGTEAVMQAVRLARYHTGRTHLVRFCGAYHGWWGDVQPGVGNPQVARDTYTLAEMSERALHVVRTRRDIACVLVNPLQALHPNRTAPSDGALVDSGRRAGFDRAAYRRWLAALRAACDANGVVLIVDDVFLGFRVAPGGTQAYFDVRADLVTYGKTLGGGLPVGVLCGTRALMRRFRDDRPVDVCLARGTFNAHPSVMGTMAAFLDRMETDAVRALYHGLDARWDARAARFNQHLAAAGLPVRIAHLSTVWTVLYETPSRYNWMLQYYLRAEGIALSWVGTGRMIFSLDWSDADFAAFTDRFVAACRRMAADGWWWHAPEATDRGLRRDVLREIAGAAFRERRNAVSP